MLRKELGAIAEHPEVGYGWIEPGATLESPFTKSLLRVRRFWEKPPLHVAQLLHARGCLWNTFVMIGRASAFLEILKAAVPQILRAFGVDGYCSAEEFSLARRDAAYAELTPGDFSRQVLSVSTERLAVLHLKDAGWSDLGTPERVMLAMTRSGLRLDWQRSVKHEDVEDLATTSAS